MIDFLSSSFLKTIILSSFFKESCARYSALGWESLFSLNVSYHYLKIFLFLSIGHYSLVTFKIFSFCFSEIIFWCTLVCFCTDAAWDLLHFFDLWIDFVFFQIWESSGYYFFKYFFSFLPYSTHLQPFCPGISVIHMLMSLVLSLQSLSLCSFLSSF